VRGRISGSSLRIDRFFQRGWWEGDLQIEVEGHRSRAGHSGGREQVRQARVRWRLRDLAAFTWGRVVEGVGSAFDLVSVA